MKWMRLLFCGGLALSMASPAGSMTTDQSLLEHLDDLIKNSPTRTLQLNWKQIPERELDRELASVYRKRNLQPLWVDINGPSLRAAQLRDLLRSADSEGLDPADYPVSVIEQLWDKRYSNALAKLDIALTFGLVAYVNDIAHGRLRVGEKDPNMFVSNRAIELGSSLILEQMLIVTDLQSYVRGFAPVHPQYRKLRAALKQYRQIVAEGGWPRVPEGPTLRFGETDMRIPVVRGRLFISGDLAPGGGKLTEEYFDEKLITAIKRFQGRHGLVADGVVGTETLAELNVPAVQRVRQIEMNMERWRWLDIDSERDYVLVDIAGFRLYRVRNGQTELQMPVIVGKQYNETPVFSDKIEYIEFNPYWNVPPSIAREEILPKLRENPGYLGTKRMRLFSGWHEDALEVNPHAIDWLNIDSNQMGYFKVRQEPGPWNSLGTMKFIFPNHHSVYLHDTPNRDLFWREKRAFSHGCVRVANPTELAISLLGGKINGWNEKNIEGILESGRRKIARLKEPVTVHIAYQTAWIDDYGRTLFPRDIYGRDAKLAQALHGNTIDRRNALSGRSVRPASAIAN